MGVHRKQGVIVFVVSFDIIDWYLLTLLTKNVSVVDKECLRLVDKECLRLFLVCFHVVDACTKQFD